jgi:hypothetical protein
MSFLSKLPRWWPWVLLAAAAVILPAALPPFRLNLLGLFITNLFALGQISSHFLQNHAPSLINHAPPPFGELFHFLPIVNRGVAWYPAQPDFTAGADRNQLGRHRRSQLLQPRFHVMMQILGIHKAPLLEVRRTGADAFDKKAGVHRKIVAGLGGAGGFN